MTNLVPNPSFGLDMQSGPPLEPDAFPLLSADMRVHKKPLLLGEAPSKHHMVDGVDMARFPMSGSVNRMLLKILEIDVEHDGVTPLWTQLYWALAEKFDLENIFDEPVEKWDSVLAAERVRAMMLDEPHRVVVLCGAKVWNATWEAARGSDPSLITRTWHFWEGIGTWIAAPISHPSGLNRMYNAKAERSRARDTLTQATAWTGAGTTVGIHTGTLRDSRPGWHVSGVLPDGTVIRSPRADIYLNLKE